MYWSNKPCLHAQPQKHNSNSGNFPGGEAFEQLFGPVRGEFEQNFSKNSNAWHVKASI